MKKKNAKDNKTTLKSISGVKETIFIFVKDITKNKFGSHFDNKLPIYRISNPSEGYIMFFNVLSGEHHRFCENDKISEEEVAILE